MIKTVLALAFAFFALPALAQPDLETLATKKRYTCSARDSAGRVFSTSGGNRSGTIARALSLCERSSAVGGCYYKNCSVKIKKKKKKKHNH